MPNTALFDATLPVQSTEIDGFVLRRGKVFEVGDFPDKNFSLSADEAQAAIAKFQPCDANLEHKSTILDSRLGKLVDVSLAPDGKTIFGSLLEPKWLSDLLPDGERKVSLEWDMGNKTIQGIAHVLNPRITDAAVFSAYAKFSRGEEVQPLSITPQENKTMPVTEPIEVEINTKVNEPKSFMERFHALFSGAKPEDIASVETAFVTAKTGKTPNEIALETKLAQFTADAEAQRVAGIKTAAVAEANRLIEEKKILPADKEAVVAAFSAAAEIDANLPKLACFTADNAAPAEFKLTDHLKGVYAKLPEHNKTEEETGSIDPKLIAAFDQSQTVATNKKTGEVVDWEEVNRARAENNMQPVAK